MIYSSKQLFSSLVPHYWLSEADLFQTLYSVVTALTESRRHIRWWMSYGQSCPGELTRSHHGWSIIGWRSWSWPRFHRKCWQQSGGRQERVRMPDKKSVGSKDKTQLLQGIRLPRRTWTRFNVWVRFKPDIQIEQMRITETEPGYKNARLCWGFDRPMESHREKCQTDDWSDPCLLTAFSYHCPLSSLSFLPSHWPPLLCWNTPFLFLFHDFVMLVPHLPELELTLVFVCLFVLYSWALSHPLVLIFFILFKMEYFCP